MASKGRIAIVGAGPGGMAAALAAHKKGFEVRLFERYPEVKPAGNILNLWPPPQQILKLIGVDTGNLGAPCAIRFERHDGRKRADVVLPEEVVREYGGGFIGLIRWGLYKRMLAAMPAGMLQLDHDCQAIEDRGRDVLLRFRNGREYVADVVIGADGLNSFVRRHLWGDEPIRHQRLHLVGGYLLWDGEAPTEGVIAHDRTTQCSYTPIRHDDKVGYEWWVLEACDPDAPPPPDLLGWAAERATNFSPTMRDLIARTPPEHVQRWPIRDRVPRDQWSKGRITLVGDAAHPTSPYAAYGAGMSIEDGYFLAHELAAVDLADTGAARRALQAYEERRKPHTVRVVQEAYMTGKAFHHMPALLRPLRDLVYDHTPFLQKVIGNDTPQHICAQLDEIRATLATGG
ncbi:FAD-dependent oxidoreductase [Massilia orientalis]|uniref:FAD-dependent oxidoreductase n=1 Tax=Massilia orientalis TaxID=3050128 RepID=A0ACC7M8U1_9BURK|nr:NAD(P)/FAD-dependent oxidoreductase [Massilia sp. YIM B02787]